MLFVVTVTILRLYCSDSVHCNYIADILELYCLLSMAVGLRDGGRHDIIHTAIHIVIHAVI